MHPVVNILLDISKNVHIGEHINDWDIINVNGVEHTFCTISYYIFMCLFNGKNRVSMIDMKASLGIQDEEILHRLFSIVKGYFWNRDIFYDDFHVFLSWAKMDDLCKILDLIVYHGIRDTLSIEKKDVGDTKKEKKVKKEEEVVKKEKGVVKKEEGVVKKEKSWGSCLFNELINAFII